MVKNKNERLFEKSAWIRYDREVDYFVIDEFIYKEGRKMIVMDVKADNFMAFRNFHMNMSYPKKIVDSFVPDEFLNERPNFRYRKVNILMGTNATGKTSIGRMLMKFFNFMDKKESNRLTEMICNPEREASFSMDFVVSDFTFYRVETRIRPRIKEDYSSSDVRVKVKSVEIGKKDSYESCVKRIEDLPDDSSSSYVEELEKIEGLTWLFKYPSESLTKYKIHSFEDQENYVRILDQTLRVLDPSIQKVEKVDNVDDAYVIRMGKRSIIMQDGKIIDNNILSSGTKEGIELADMLACIRDEEYGFYYCDEKFSYIHTDIEKAFLTVMINALKSNDQLFFTTHNMDILDLPLPHHSYHFLRKDPKNEEEPVKCISASEFLKRNTDSRRHAVENDLFSVAPDVELIYDILQ